MTATALVIGTGQLGQELARARAARLDVRVIGRDTINVANATDVRDAVKRLQPRIVLNASGYTAVDRAETDREAAFAVNRDGVAALAEACAALGIPLIHVSTDYVFDGEAGPYAETDAPAPGTVYGESKRQGEDLVRSRLERHIILRTAWLFGAFGNNFVKTMLRLSETRSAIRVVDDQFGCPTPAAALADAMIALAERATGEGGLAWGTYHYAGQPATTWRRFAERIFDRAAVLGLISHVPQVTPITTKQFPTAARRPANSVLNCGRLSALGLAPPDWRAGLDDVIGEMKMASVNGSAVH